MSQSPVTFSVVIPLYNGELTIERAINSVLKQSYPQFEIVVVDDGSTDSSSSKLLNIKDPRLRVIKQKNRGVSAARNKGIAEARNEWIAFLDADDEWLPDFLVVIVALMKKYPACTVLSTGYFNCSSVGSYTLPIRKRLIFEGDDGVVPNYFQVSTYSSPPITSSSVVIKKEKLLEIGCFPEGVASGEDLITWSSLALVADIAYRKTPMVIIHTDTDRPHRVPQIPDYVGLELRNLIKVAPPFQRPWLKRYLAKWHKMRAHSYITQQKRVPALKESIRSLMYNPFTKVWLFLPILLLPTPLTTFILRARKYFHN
jgi:glycosyltransferase involved in cell wall biosynthesis